MPLNYAEQAHLSPDDIADCRACLRVGSRSFHAAAYLLPGGFREPAAVLYAFCRLADDAVDDGADPAQALSEMHRRLDDIYAGRPAAVAADRALARVVASIGMPKELLTALFEGFAWDVEGRRYADLSGVQAYSARVAGTVGAMMAVLMGVRHAQLLARACDLGVAMQLTNIARDVGEDARNGRLYLPEDWLRQVGIEPDAFLEDPQFSPALGKVVRRLLDCAEVLYRRADSGIALLPVRCRPAMYAARLLYAEIGYEVARCGFDSVSQRAVISSARKAQVLSCLPGLLVLPTAELESPALDETEFLVTAAATAGGLPAPVTGVLTRMEQKAAWVLDLFDEVERRERMQSSLVNELVS